ncbi:MAG TPA: hypothetical protein VHE81_09095 [Lacipirellulaceae bacterium]|nr:hypothetical protein [Lacipirellulaceae bacterium]
MRFARWVFLLAGICGIIVIIPPYFLEQRFGQDHPPAVSHPEFYYGFLGVTLAWQILFLLIAYDPIRYRLAMLPAMLEKATFVVAIFGLYMLGRISGSFVSFAAVDAIWLVLFLVAFLGIPNVRAPAD